MTPSRPDLPTGTVTFLFTDIEDSTRTALELGPDAYRELLEQHHALLRDAFGRHGAVERGTQGDAFFVAFKDAPSAVAAAVDAQRALAAARWPDGIGVRVRMGVHSGQGIAGGDDYVGVDVNRAARIASAAHGGQVLLSDAARSLSERSLPDGIELRDLGRHQLKDLPGDERLFQVLIGGLRSEFPPLRTPGLRLANLPDRVTSFVGRDRELGELVALVDGERLVTLVGPGGTGKSSLAIELARQLADRFTDGAWFVPLDRVADPDLVCSVVVGALGLREVSGRSARERLIDNLSQRSLLLVLDNFEHLRDAAGVVADLLAGAPALRLLVTSRAPLQVTAEQVFPVAPLPLPVGDAGGDLRTVDTVPSVRLFVDRVRRGQPGFVLTSENVGTVIEICRRLDGLPLGIELAAARVRVFGAAGVRDRLASRLALPGTTMQDVPVRQRTLGDTVAWSHDLLDRPGRTLFARLAVFAGGCRPDELERVCGPLAEIGADVLDTVATLVDQSLVTVSEHRTGTRFAMLETIRDYASERFAQLDDRAALGRRHADAYLDMAETGALDLPGRRQQVVMDRLALEHDNLRAAIGWAIDNREVEIGLRFGTALTWFWCLRGELEEARETFARLLAMPAGDRPTATRMRALESAGTIDYYGGRMDLAAARYAEQLALARELGDEVGIADALFDLTFTTAPSEWPRERAPLDEAEAIYRAVGDERKQARVLWARGAGAKMAGRDDEALRLWQEAYSRLHAVDDAYYESLAASSLGAAALESGDREAAARWFVVAMTLARVTSDVAGETLALPVAAAAVLDLVGPEPAATMMGAYETLSRRFGVQPPPGLAMIIEQGDVLTRTRAALEPAAFATAFQRGQAMGPEEAVAFVLEQVDRMSVPPARGMP